MVADVLARVRPMAAVATGWCYPYPLGVATATIHPNGPPTAPYVEQDRRDASTPAPRRGPASTCEGGVADAV